MPQFKRKRHEKYIKEIEMYCDSNVGKKVLALVFINLYPEYGKRNKRNLLRYTSRILGSLDNEGILQEVKKPSEFNTPHPMYLILPHIPLVEEKGFVKDPYNFDFTQGPLKY